jgi:quaternary ammonium compound-resistance protein SugE
VPFFLIHLLMALAMRALSVSTAYAVWAGIGIAGTTVVGMAILGESVSTQKRISLMFILIGILGLRLASG